MDKIRNIVVTGASGFFGSYLCESLFKLPQSKVLGVVRYPLVDRSKSYHVVCDISGRFYDSMELHNTEVIVHCAALTHILCERHVADRLAEFRKVNFDVTLSLAQQAARSGVKRFIFISSIKVNGECNSLGHAYRHDDPPAPEDAYGQSKAMAETGLKALAAETGMEVVIIRPPLVYGPGVKANFLAMMKLARKNLPLPLGAVHNKRSLVALDNLVDLVVTCIDHPKAANETFLISDGHDLSTTELLTLMTQAAGKKPHLLPLPMGMVRWGFMAIGKKALADRLCGSLQVDITHTRETLGWSPPVTVEEAVRRCFEE